MRLPPRTKTRLRRLAAKYETSAFVDGDPIRFLHTASGPGVETMAFVAGWTAESSAPSRVARHSGPKSSARNCATSAAPAAAQRRRRGRTRIMVRIVAERSRLPQGAHRLCGRPAVLVEWMS